jgi:hypothetical protein
MTVKKELEWTERKNEVTLRYRKKEGSASKYRNMRVLYGKKEKKKERQGKERKKANISKTQQFW